ncbi:hypothetical protein M408DRAFT_264970, partial [Serendipita vermifera MAFF 305830]
MSTCHYFNSPQGCRRSPCRFLHVQASGSGQPSGPSATPAGRPYLARPNAPPLQLTSPPGTCRYFYNYGNCKIADQCKFRHVEPGQLVHQGHPGGAHGIRAIPMSTMTNDKIIPASEAIQHVVNICAPRTVFTKPFQMANLVRMLVAASSKHESWDDKESQRFLELVTESHGASRIEFILTYPTVLPRPQNQRDAISFTAIYLGCLSYFVTDFVLNSPLHHRVNLLFGILHTKYDRFYETVMTCMSDIVTRRSFEDPPSATASGVVVFNTLILVLIEYLTRYKTACRDHGSLIPLVESINVWFNAWKSGGFTDGWVPESEHVKTYTLDQLQRHITRLSSIVRRESAAIARKGRNGSGDAELGISPEEHYRHHAALVGPLEIQYDPPGQLRELGPRHDNDSEDIRVIEIPPTEQEMISPVSPFLPANIPGAPHHLGTDSMERLLDIQFRLLREELLAPLRMAIQMIITDLRNPSRNTLLQSIMDHRGGRYIAQISQVDSTMVNLYTSVNPLRIATDKRGISVELSMDTPPGSARVKSAGRRAEYWRAVSRKRLMQGGLVGLLWKQANTIQLFFGLISSSAEDLLSSVRQDNESLRLRIKFFEAEVNSKVMEWCQLEDRDRRGYTILMIEAPVMYESIRPFLQALQREPTSFPFAQYLVHQPTHYGGGQPMQVRLPRYTMAHPNFIWDIRCLFNNAPALPPMDPQDPQSIEQARLELKASSRLDDSQADAMVDCLTKEFVLIQGPPGTGKSFTGVEIMRVLLANNAGRILLIAFTNHALDHLLLSVLDAGITKRIVRLGSRSNDERIAQYSLESLERLSTTSTTSQISINRAYGARKRAETELREVLLALQGGPVDNAERITYMENYRPEHYDEILHPPVWIEQLREMEAGWTDAQGRLREEPRSEYDFWLSCTDIHWIQAQITAQETQRQESANQFSALTVEGGESDDEWGDDSMSFSDSDGHIFESEEDTLRNQFLHQAGLMELPRLPSSNRPLDELQEDPMVWLMSDLERDRIHKAWTESTRQHFFDDKRQRFAHLKTRFEEAQVAYDECQSQARLSMLGKVDIIGCTTTGAAKLTNLLTGIRPSIVLVEEAGQVLEAHVLGSLVPSIEHVIMIGDPLQLRPNISNYGLSMDHPRGKAIYKFDQSTMERLDNAGMPMSKLSVQRRMRPEISAIARRTLYKHLEDNERVKSYPDVRGLAQNMFFFHHTHPEGGENEESMSKFNTFEVSMIKGLVQHLLRQGCYTKSGSIVVLCMYLGQLAKIRDEFKDSKISVVLDARDEEELRNRESDEVVSEDEPIIEVAEVKVTDQVLLRTVDNFQGEEADVVLLSLVRNPGEGRPGSIGFLKSPNRVNVALTRARHGLYVFGNGDLLIQKSSMWRQVIQEFKDCDAYGSALPVACHRHKTDVQWVRDAKRLRQISPDGGCLRPCDSRLKCGHTCPSKCHADDEEHRFVRCYQACRRACSKGHPCKRECWVPCGSCDFPLPQLTLDCGHVLYNAPCYLQDDRSTYRCREQVEKRLPDCEHRVVVDCFEDPSEIQCRVLCGELMACCQRLCNSRCCECQHVSALPGTRDEHKRHPCGRIMHCQHPCLQPCEIGHGDVCGTSDCSQACRQSCDHHICPLGCSAPCTPCVMPCPWKCEHHECRVPCGSPCIRLPCDTRCTKTLSCGHPCPSLCGEPCGQQQCRECASPGDLNKVVDLILHLTLDDIDPSSDDLDNITITLKCRHTFTVETLDGVCELAKAYERDATGNVWSRLLLSSETFVKTPCCPTCRAPITARRYGRLTKRGNLDLLERNVATKMARELASLQATFHGIDRAALGTGVQDFAPRSDFVLSDKALQGTQKKRDQYTRPSRKEPVLPVDLLGRHMQSICGLHRVECNRWVTTMKPLLNLYQKVHTLSCQRTAHSSAYEASFSMLYEYELMLARHGPHPPRHPETFALQVAKTKVGMAPPRADTRFQVEAIWMSIDIRVLIAGFAEKLFSNLVEKKVASPAQLLAWANFITFIHNSCFHDASCAAAIARTTSAHRQELLSGLRMFKATWRRTQFSVIIDQSRPEGLTMDERN